MGLTPFVLLLTRHLPRVGDRAVQEMAQGYITLTLITGDFWLARLRSWRGYGTHMPWDYRGLWVYGVRDRAGRLDAQICRWTLRATTRPPTTPTLLELWTGTVWSGHFRPWTSSGVTAQH